MLTLICGLPRAGKTTYSQRYDRVVHLDDYESNRYQQCIEAIQQGGDIAVEGLYTRAKTRKMLREAYQGKAVCIWIDTPLGIRRQRKGYSPRNSEYFEPPTYDEGWDEIIVLDGGVG